MKKLALALTTLSALMIASSAHGAQAQYEVMTCTFKWVQPGEKYDLKVVAKIQNRDKNQDFTDKGDGSVSIEFEGTPTTMGYVKAKGSSLVSLTKTRAANGEVLTVKGGGDKGAVLAMRAIQGSWIDQLFADQPQAGASFNTVVNYVFKVPVSEQAANVWASQFGQLKDLSVVVTGVSYQSGVHIGIAGTKTNGEPISFIQGQGSCTSEFVNLPSAL